MGLQILVVREKMKENAMSLIYYFSKQGKYWWKILVVREKTNFATYYQLRNQNPQKFITLSSDFRRVEINMVEFLVIREI